jgi:hypothetical protein
MKLIDRYIHAVAQALPESRREEITRELKANILDKLEALAEEKGREPSDEEISAVLKDLGHPQKVAGSFLTGQQLVSTELFPFYKQTLHYGLILVLILALIQLGTHLLNTGHLSVANFFYEMIHKSLIMFASVTGVFYLLSNPVGGKDYFDPYQCWSPEKLPLATRPWQRISTVEQSFDFATDVFFLLMLNHTLWMSATQLQELTITFAEPVTVWIPIMSAILIGSLLLGIWKLIYRYWTVTLLILDAIITFVSAMILLIVSRINPIVIDISKTQEHMDTMQITNKVIEIGLFWVGLFLVFMAGLSVYRAWKLSR